MLVKNFIFCLPEDVSFFVCMDMSGRGEAYIVRSLVTHAVYTSLVTHAVYTSLLCIVFSLYYYYY